MDLGRRSLLDAREGDEADALAARVGAGNFELLRVVVDGGRGVALENLFRDPLVDCLCRTRVDVVFGRIAGKRGSFSIVIRL